MRIAWFLVALLDVRKVQAIAVDDKQVTRRKNLPPLGDSILNRDAVVEPVKVLRIHQ